MRILIGSSALKKFDIDRNEPKDLDYFIDTRNYTNQKGEDHTYLPTEILKQIPTIRDTATPDFTYFKHLFKTLDLGNNNMDGQKLIDEMMAKYIALKPKDWNEDIITEIEEREFICEIVVEGDEALGLKILDGETGGEGEAEYCYVVFSYEGKIYKAEFSYYSHEGCDYDNFAESIREVTPSQKTVTVYE